MANSQLARLRGNYASEDDQGNALFDIVGCEFQVLEPGMDDPVIVGSVPYPDREFDFYASKEGQYAARHRTVRAAVTQGVDPASHACVVPGHWSAWTKFMIKFSRPKAPDSAAVIVACPAGDCADDLED